MLVVLFQTWRSSFWFKNGGKGRKEQVLHPDVDASKLLVSTTWSHPQLGRTTPPGWELPYSFNMLDTLFLLCLFSPFRVKLFPLDQPTVRGSDSLKQLLLPLLSCADQEARCYIWQLWFCVLLILRGNCSCSIRFPRSLQTFSFLALGLGARPCLSDRCSGSELVHVSVSGYLWCVLLLFSASVRHFVLLLKYERCRRNKPNRRFPLVSTLMMRRSHTPAGSPLIANSCSVNTLWL